MRAIPDLLVQLVFMLVEVEGKRREVITPHELAESRAGGWGEEATGHMPDDPMPLVSQAWASDHGAKEHSH